MERSGSSGIQTFKFEGANTVGTLTDSQYAKYVLAEKDATLTAPEGATVTTNLVNYEVVYENGVYFVELIKVAKIGDTYYATIADAIAAAQAGDIITLVANHTEHLVELEKGITLDLNGYTLTADYVVAFNGNHIVDNSTAKTGKLAIAKDAVALAADNTQMPIYNDGGYTFSTIKWNGKNPTTLNAGKTDNFTITFRPTFESNGALDSFFKNGATDTGVQFIVRLAKDDGAIVTDYIFTEDVIKTVYANSNSTKGFSINVNNVKTAISVYLVLKSDSGVEMVKDLNYTFTPVVTESTDTAN